MGHNGEVCNRIFALEELTCIIRLLELCIVNNPFIPVHKEHESKNKLPTREQTCMQFAYKSFIISHHEIKIEHSYFYVIFNYL